MFPQQFVHNRPFGLPVADYANASLSVLDDDGLSMIEGKIITKFTKKLHDIGEALRPDVGKIGKFPTNDKKGLVRKTLRSADT